MKPRWPRSIRRSPPASPRAGSCTSLFEGLVSAASRQQSGRAGRRREMGDLRRRPRLHVSSAEECLLVERRAGDGARFSLFDPSAARSAYRSRATRIRRGTSSMRSATTWAAAQLRRAIRSKWSSNPPADAPNTVRGKLLLGKLVRIDVARSEKAIKSAGRDRIYVVEHRRQRASLQAASNDDPSRRAGRALPTSAARFSRSWRAVIDDRTLEIRLTDRRRTFSI